MPTKKDPWTATRPSHAVEKQSTLHRYRQFLYDHGVISTRENAECYGRIEGRLPRLVRQLEESA